MQWTVNPRAIPEEGCFRAAVTVGRHQVFSFGGCADKPHVHIDGLINVHVFNTVSLTWRELPPAVTPGGGKQSHPEVPSCRITNQTAVLVGDSVYVWGGYNCFTLKSCNVLYAFDVDAHTWSKHRVSGTVPEGRWGHSACALGKVMFIHGGHTDTNPAFSNDMYKLHTGTMVWTVITAGGTPPPASFRHSATVIGTKMFVFGGQGDEGESYDTVRVFDTETDRWMDTPSTQPLLRETPSAQPRPEGRWFHSAFTHNGELYILNGWNGTKPFHDLWKCSPETFSWKEVKVKGKGPSRTINGGCCIVGNLFLFGTDYVSPEGLFVLDLSPSLKTLCKLAVIQHGLDQSELPHDVRWELAAMMDK